MAIPLAGKQAPGVYRLKVGAFVPFAVVEVIIATFASAAHQRGQSLEGQLPENWSRGLGPATYIARNGR
jgi:hypothetical protein